MITDASIAHAKGYKPHPTDVYIATYPKSGTTWTQQICHGLRSRGDLSFDEISQVVPYDITAFDCGLDLKESPQWSPKLLKTHSMFQNVPKGARYIYVLRNPDDVFLSFFNFLPAYFGVSGITLDDFAHDIFLRGTRGAGGTYWDHVLTWLPHFEDPDVLVVFYEDLVQDLRGCVRAIADFMNIPLHSDTQLEDTVVRQAGLEFMKAHVRKFDDHFLHSFVTARLGYSSVPEPKVRTKARDNSIPPHLKASLDEQWAVRVAKVVGYDSYSDLRDKFSLLKKKTGTPQ